MKTLLQGTSALVNHFICTKAYCTHSKMRVTSREDERACLVYSNYKQHICTD
ncbi:hypothetical protein C1H46_045881 [Malus baccata]|uniref:Uncharacterized protein n=1 Tax=Malus baccata TaxID=106549 RepID=A0A540K2S8_MALBA|nr:hypothetical protein C1H46_045881 [Malus baccata]